VDKVDGHDTDKFEWIKLELLTQPTFRFQVLPTVCYLQGWMQLPEDWIKWVMAFCGIENLMPIREPADKTRMFRTLLKGQALS
jgi:hypothetical protein